MADKIYIDNDKLSLFHGFSKTPVSSKIALGNAINKSGHTVQSSEIWSDEIPYFGKFGTTQVAHDTVSKDTVYGDMLYIGGNSYYKRNAVEYAEGKTFNELWTNVTADFKDGYVFENKHGKGVIVYHQNQYLQNLNDDNNANTNSENCAARLWVYETKEGESKKVARLVEQFVGPTDKALNGLASVSYSPIVKPVGGEAYEEGTQYSLVGFSGTVLWSEDRANTVTAQSDGSVTSQFQISCFEYIGDKLSTSIGDIQSDISELDDKLSKISVTAAGGVQAVSDAAKSAGFEIESVVVEGVTTPTLDLTTAVITDGIFNSTAGNKAKLVTAADVESYVSKNAKVSVNGQDATTITVAGTAQGSSDLVKVVVTEDKDTASEIGLTLTASVTAATVGSDGSVTNDGLVKASDAVKIAAKAAAGVDVGVTGVINAGASVEGKPTGGNKHGVTLNLYGSEAYVAVDTAAYESASKKFTNSTNYLTTAADVTAYVTDAIADVKTTANSAIQGITINNGADNDLVKVGEGNIVDITLPSNCVAGDNSTSHGFRFSTLESGDPSAGASGHYLHIANAAYNTNTKTWVDDTLNYFTTASSVKTAIADAISGIDFPDVKVYGGSNNYGISFTTQTGEGAGSSHYMHIATAEYAASTDSWANKSYLITGATVEAFVNDVVSEVSSDLTALENKVNAYHEAGVSYVVYDKAATESELPDLSVPANIEKYKNVILLVPTDNSTGNHQEPTAAMSGSYVEWLCVNKGTNDAPSWDWEQIGTTEADLRAYARGIEANGETYWPAVATGYINLGSFASTVASGQATTLANQGSIYANIADDGTLTLGAASATDSVMGVSKLFTNALTPTTASTVTDTAVSVKTAASMYSVLATMINAKPDSSDVVSSINGIKGAVTLCVHNHSGQDNDEEGEGSPSSSPSNHANLWGMTFIAPDHGNKVILVDEFVGMSRTYLTTANLPSDAIRVENNFVMARMADYEYVTTTIRPERMVGGFYAQYASGLTSFVGDLSNLETAQLNGGGSSTFYTCSALETFIGDLSSLKHGAAMFAGCSNLTTFIGDLSSLEKGGNSTDNSYTAGMFDKTNLSVESVENIADTLPENPVVDVKTGKGSIGISWQQLTADTAKRQELVDALSGVVDKGWALYTNSELRTMFDTEKYKVVESFIQPLDLDSEPQEIAYVIKK